MGAMLGKAVKLQDPEVFDIVEKLRKLGREWRTEGKEAAFDEMVSSVRTCDAAKLFNISRAFSNFLALSNSAENHHRIRRLRLHLNSSGSQYGLWPKADSCSGSISNLLKDGVSTDKIMSALLSQNVEIVLTAHPTEVNRRTMLRKHRRVNEILNQQDQVGLSIYERNLLQQQLEAEIISIWDSDSLRRMKPTPVDEARFGLAIVENVLWEAVPSFLRKLDDITEHELHKRLPLDCAPIKIGSWMGGDRDGNPNVTPEVTLEVSLQSRWLAASLYQNDVKELRASLSVRPCSAELLQASGNAHEPYRELLKQLEKRLQATLQWTERLLIAEKMASKEDLKQNTEEITTAKSKKESIKPILRKEELMAPLQLIYRSLNESGLQAIANGSVLDTIRRIAVFGTTLMPLDIRQESTRHTEALDAITKYLGLAEGTYAQWDEKFRRNWLRKELNSKRSLLPRGVNYEDLKFSSTVIDTLRTFDLIAQLDGEELGAYVISQCQQTSDILAVLLLQQESGVRLPLRVVPLFETLDDLQRSADTVESLFSIEEYRCRINNRQEIMVGYSDSAKDAGRLAASWQQYQAQVAMMQVADKHKVELTFFHGKGGTVGRGGNPALFEAILAHPPNTIQGRFRVTEQGEMITRNFGQIPVAERTMDLFTAGVLTEKFIARPSVKPEWHAVMERLSEISCKTYRHVVREEPRFVPYFRSATPELELSGLNVGSRPAKRNPQGGVDSLRAIPWNFAWTQTRLNLPTWLGVGEAFSSELSQNPTAIKTMAAEWPWFRTLVDLLEMILVKSELKIAENYDAQLVTEPESVMLGKELRQKMQDTVSAVLEVSGNERLQQNNRVLLRSLSVRNPYVDPLNVIQAELLRRLRLDGENALSASEREKLKDALLITINGIANGMRNSG
jgi:phosphoenolpyruvate carboxylase